MILQRFENCRSGIPQLHSVCCAFSENKVLCLVSGPFFHFYVGGSSIFIWWGGGLIEKNLFTCRIYWGGWEGLVRVATDFWLEVVLLQIPLQFLLAFLNAVPDSNLLSAWGCMEVLDSRMHSEICKIRFLQEMAVFFFTF